MQGVLSHTLHATGGCQWHVEEVRMQDKSTCERSAGSKEHAGTAWHAYERNKKRESIIHQRGCARHLVLAEKVRALSPDPCFPATHGRVRGR